MLVEDGVIVLASDVKCEVNKMVEKNWKWWRISGWHTHAAVGKFSSTVSPPSPLATQTPDATSCFLPGQCFRWPFPSHQSGCGRFGPTCHLALSVSGKSHGRRSLVGCSPWGHEESDATERLHFHFSLSCTGEGNAVYGVAQSRTRLKRLTAVVVTCQDIHFMDL